MAAELVAAADVVADGSGRDRRDLGPPRAAVNGSEFTVDTFARYHLHDVGHHTHDVRRAAARATVAAYDRRREVRTPTARGS